MAIPKPLLPSKTDELADEPDPLAPSSIEAGLVAVVSSLVSVISNGPRAGYPGRFMPEEHTGA